MSKNGLSVFEAKTQPKSYKFTGQTYKVMINKL